MKVTEVCDECARNCVLMHGTRKDASPAIISFSKILYGDYDFSKFLYLPPAVSKKLSARGCQQNIDLEDSNGQRWTVTLAYIEDGLAFDKGWPRFYTDHGLREGDLLIFNYVIGSHFVVRIYGKSCCEKLHFDEATSNPRKRSKSNGKFHGEDGMMCKLTSNDLSNNQGSGDFVIPGSQNGNYSELVMGDRNLSLENSSGRELALTADYDMQQFCMLNRDAINKHEEERSCLYDLSNFEMQSRRVDADGSSVKRLPPPPNCMLKSPSAAGIPHEKPVSMGVIGCELPAEGAAFAKNHEKCSASSKKKAKNIDCPSGLLKKKSAARNEANRINGATTPKIVKCMEAGYADKHSSEIRKDCQKEQMEMNKRSSSKNRNAGIDPKFFTECGRSSSRAEKGETAIMCVKEPMEIYNLSSRQSKSAIISEKKVMKKIKTSGKDENILNKLEQSSSRAGKGEAMKACKEELMDIDTIPSCNIMNSAMVTNLSNGLNQSTSQPEKDNNEVLTQVKAEPVYSDDAYSPDTSNNSCSAVVGSPVLMELAESLPSISLRRADKKVVNLKCPNTRPWPVLYHEEFGLKFLTSGWAAFYKSNSLRPGDECVFILENGPESTYNVSIVRK